MSDLDHKAQLATVLLSRPELHGMVAGFLAASACPTVEAFPLSELVALVGDQALTDEQAVLDFVAASLANLRDEDMLQCDGGRRRGPVRAGHAAAVPAPAVRSRPAAPCRASPCPFDKNGFETT